MDSDKPQTKCEVAVGSAYPQFGAIYFYGTRDAAGDLEQFGELLNSGSNYYRLQVDSRFDFAEVLAYIAREYPREV